MSDRIKDAIKPWKPTPKGTGKNGSHLDPEDSDIALNANGEPVVDESPREPEPRHHANGDPGPDRRGPSSSQSWNQAYTTEPPPRERIPLKIVSATECAETDPPETATVLGDHWLFRGGWNALIGPTGQGKTSISAQMGALWCLGFPAFGIEPNGKLRVMLVQVENDAADLHEMMNGILKEIDATDEERKWLHENFIVVTPQRPTPDLFATDGEITELIVDWKPDLVLLDSLYKWTPKGNAADSEGLFHTIDQTLLPLAKARDFGLLASHHMGRTEVLRIANGESTMLSDLYSGAGGMFVADNARGTLLLLPEGDEPGQYVLRGAKRKSRLGWRDKEGVKIYQKHLQWAEGRIGWNEVDDATAAQRKHQSEARKADKKSAKKQDHVLWAIRQAGGGDGALIQRDKVIAAAKRSGGPIPAGMSEKPVRDEITAMDGVSLRIEERKSSNNRPAKWVKLIQP
jgi:hypothetical protein